MKMTQRFTALSFVFTICMTANLFAQKSSNAKFESYKAGAIYTGSKAKLQLNSHPLGRSFKTAISEGYKANKVEFAGHYVVITWGCGCCNCTDGALVDAQTGRIYPLPLGEDRTVQNNCSENVPTYDFNSSSRLFISHACGSESFDSKEESVTEYQSVWNEQTKKFKLISTKTKTQQKKA